MSKTTTRRKNNVLTHSLKMDPNAIVDMLKRTLDPANRANAEQELHKCEKIIGFCPSLLQIVMNDAVDPPIR